MKNKIWIITLISLIIDQVVKLLCLNYLNNITIIPNFLSFIYAKNTGVAFSLLSDNRLIIIIISLLLTFLLIYFIYKDYILMGKKSKYKEVLFGLLLGGILGNLLDRIIRGYVIDFIAINIFEYGFPIFNIADIFITISVILIMIDYLFNNKKDS